MQNLVITYGYYDIGAEKIPVSIMCDRALLAAKSIRNNYTHRIASYHGPVSQKQLKTREYAIDFTGAVRNREFVVWYQPKMNPYAGRIDAAEALVRWIRADGTVLPPGEFMDVFEENGQITVLDEYVYRAVCLQQKKWMDRGEKLIPISVNLSRKSMARPDLVPVYRQIADDAGIPLNMVPIEITESAATRNVLIRPVVQKLYENGFSIHMDDFGSGQSSINGLHLLPVDVVKLDKSLVDTIGSKSGETIISGVMGILRELGFHTVAEGVENIEQLNFLMENHVDEIQGYYYSRPLPQEKFEEFAARWQGEGET